VLRRTVPVPCCSALFPGSLAVFQVGSPDLPCVSAFHAADDVKAPGFCCRVPGNAEGGLGRLQVSAFIGIYFGLLRLRRFAFRIVGIGFLALSKPGQPHQMPTPRLD
jgi:hypothetical protein